jgi:hypothetical protein
MMGRWLTAQEEGAEAYSIRWVSEIEETQGERSKGGRKNGNDVELEG